MREFKPALKSDYIKKYFAQNIHCHWRSNDLMFQNQTGLPEVKNTKYNAVGNPSSVIVPKKTIACATEGMSAGGSTLDSAKCCSGLVQTNSYTHQHLATGCDSPAMPGSGGSCVVCGDNMCDSKNYENKCNCPKDCK